MNSCAPKYNDCAPAKEKQCTYLPVWEDRDNTACKDQCAGYDKDAAVQICVNNLWVLAKSLEDCNIDHPVAGMAKPVPTWEFTSFESLFFPVPEPTPEPTPEPYVPDLEQSSQIVDYLPNGIAPCKKGILMIFTEDSVVSSMQLFDLAGNEIDMATNPLV